MTLEVVGGSFDVVIALNVAHGFRNSLKQT